MVARMRIWSKPKLEGSIFDKNSSEMLFLQFEGKSGLTCVSGTDCCWRTKTKIELCFLNASDQFFYCNKPKNDQKIFITLSYFLFSDKIEYENQNLNFSSNMTRSVLRTFCCHVVSRAVGYL